MFTSLKAALCIERAGTVTFFQETSTGCQLKIWKLAMGSAAWGLASVFPLFALLMPRLILRKVTAKLPLTVRKVRFGPCWAIKALGRPGVGAHWGSCGADMHCQGSLSATPAHPCRLPDLQALWKSPHITVYGTLSLRWSLNHSSSRIQKEQPCCCCIKQRDCSFLLSCFWYIIYLTIGRASQMLFCWWSHLQKKKWALLSKQCSRFRHLCPFQAVGALKERSPMSSPLWGWHSPPGTFSTDSQCLEQRRDGELKHSSPGTDRSACLWDYSSVRNWDGVWEEKESHFCPLISPLHRDFVPLNRCLPLPWNWKPPLLFSSWFFNASNISLAGNIYVSVVLYLMSSGIHRGDIHGFTKINL